MITKSTDLVLENANVITCDSNLPKAEAIAIKSGRIVQVGNNEAIAQFKGKQTQTIDCQGKTLVPGFNDAHCHVFSLINKIFSLDLSPAKVSSIRDIKNEIARKVRFSPEGRLISGSAYNDFYLAEKRHPTKFDLDEVSPRNPVILFHRSSHACVLNSLALKMVGINNETEEPSGGIIERDLDSGEPNGILFEMSRYIGERLVSPISEAELDWALQQVDEIYLSNGITSIGEASISNDFTKWQTYLKIKNQNKLKSRIYMMFGVSACSDFIKAGLKTGAGDSNLKLGSLKVILSEAKGRLQPSQDELNNMVIDACRAGYQLAIHAVERTTVEAAIIALEITKKRFPDSQLRHRIEHCSECPPALRSRLKKTGALVVSQPSFLYYSGERYLAQVPKQAQKSLYPFGSLLDSGILVAGSSDSPVVSNNPLIGIYSAVTRKAESGQKILASEGVSAGKSLEMFTINGAYCSLEEKQKGSLTRGKLADIVMLNRDPTQVYAEDIKEIKVELTILDGQIVWQKT